jgi:hypothetical protein
MKKELKEVKEYLLTDFEANEILEVEMIRRINVFNLAKILRSLNKDCVVEMTQIRSNWELGMISNPEFIAQSFIALHNVLMLKESIIDRYCKVWGDDKATVLNQLSVLL